MKTNSNIKYHTIINLNKLLYNINTKRLEKVDEKTLLQIKNYNGINGNNECNNDTGI
jgi:hypothetical protein